MEKSEIIFHPIISSVQKIVLYETKSKFFLVGSNNTESRFRVLKIDRTEPRELVIEDDKVEYSQEEIYELVNSIEADNRQSSYAAKITSAFGLMGFVRFLEGYYVVLINKRRKVAVIGQHSVYKIQETTTTYIPNEAVRSVHPDEARYLKMFHSVDLSSNFYFSYSYDLTRTLQHNMAAPARLSSGEANSDEDEDEDDYGERLTFPDAPGQQYAFRSRPLRKFVWNAWLLAPVERRAHPDWLVRVTHGFVDQANVCVWGRGVHVTLVARRSSRYAGTRFLKRGANQRGHVANEVETEQMVHDACLSSLHRGRFSSFVQLRGSVPAHWSQATGTGVKMVPKPPIQIDVSDPYAETPALHLADLLDRYGAPVVLLNLVKRRERKRHERLLGDELKTAVRYLNQFLSGRHHIQHVPFDMARANRRRVRADVMSRLAAIAEAAVRRTGVFLSRAPPHQGVSGRRVPDSRAPNHLVQTGVVRTNCVDCLDRTNTAQFAVGKCALAHQLTALGLVDAPARLQFDTDCARVLEALYEDHGDTLALQYGGSQLVHRVNTYRKTAPWTAQGSDVRHTLSRYLSNTFSDADKQNAINLFLGLFRPDDSRPRIWEAASDAQLHRKPPLKRSPPITRWLDPAIERVLPLPRSLLDKSCRDLFSVAGADADAVEMIDAYSDCHRPDVLTELSDAHAYTLTNTLRDFMPNFTVDYSPFSVRVGPGRRQEGRPLPPPPSAASSATSSSSSSSEPSDSSDDDAAPLESDRSCSQSSHATAAVTPHTFRNLFPSMLQVYGSEPIHPLKPDLLLYKKHVLVARKANGMLRNTTLLDALKPTCQSAFPVDSVRCVDPPTVPQASIDLYARYVRTGAEGARTPPDKSLFKYYNYVYCSLVG